ncbi:MAG: alanine--glyoxylate aminotransferase family protein [Candidatus Atribacteria bacterium]|mgnify:CR=1 FL=1|nr:alanine--glyoxylate aminotransferase family protein [Candidatus Atribacteria bacterium]
MKNYTDLNPGKRILMGPGPSDVHPRVLKTMATPLVGHLDPDFLEIMNETREMLREVYQTKNELTIAISGTGSAGMEAVLVNLLEPGDKAVVCINGYFGERMADIVRRCGAEPIILNAEWGTIVEPDEVKKVLADIGKVKLLAIVHAETSTGVRQPLEEISRLVKEAGALFVVDAVTSLAGIPVETDKWQIDAIYSGTQKCISCPPGLSPVSFSEAAREVMTQRTTPIQSWYLDMKMLGSYWGQERFYHHTAPISMSYALHEALRLVLEEGLEERFKRHKLHSKALVAGLEAMGLEMVVAPEYRLPELNSVYIPEGIDDVKVRKALLSDYGIEIGGGLGKFKGKAWRIGLMGYSCSRDNVMLLLAALENILQEQGYKAAQHGIIAAQQAYRK